MLCIFHTHYYITEYQYRIPVRRLLEIFIESQKKKFIQQNNFTIKIIDLTIMRPTIIFNLNSVVNAANTCNNFHKFIS